MTSAHAHTHAVLASCDVCIIEQCRDCDTVQLHLGTTTVRFKTPAFMVLCRTLLAALGHVESQGGAIRAAWPRTSTSGH